MQNMKRKTKKQEAETEIKNSIRKEISDLREVLDHYVDCPVWKHLCEYLQELGTAIDTNWVNTNTLEDFYRIKATKIAIFDIVNFPAKTKAKMEALEGSLKPNNDNEEIEKDYDTQIINS